jgi:hypothetical protein
LQTNHDVTCVNDLVALILHVADTLARTGDPFKVAASHHHRHRSTLPLKLSRHDLFRIHAQAGDALECRLETPSFGGCWRGA